jgi:hypothetical protein
MLSVALLGIFAAVVVAAVSPSDGTTTLPTSSTGTTTTDATNTTDRTETTPNKAGVDISGPCDEAEHANDPRCAGVNAPALPEGGADDISGPCDEAEHANDPRCTGVGVGNDDRVEAARSSSTAHPRRRRGSGPGG